MIALRVVFRGESIVAIDSSGHATRSGSDDNAACAAVSLILKAFGETIVARREVGVDGHAPRSGTFRVRVDPPASGDAAAAWYDGVSRMVLTALRAAHGAWPSQINLILDEEGAAHGS